jgi:hypothetical protein
MKQPWLCEHVCSGAPLFANRGYVNRILQLNRIDTNYRINRPNAKGELPTLIGEPISVLVAVEMTDTVPLL